MIHSPRSPLFALALLVPALACTAQAPASETSGDDEPGSTSTDPNLATTTGPPPSTTGEAGTTMAPNPGTSTGSADSTSAASEDGPPVIFDFNLPDAPPLESECGKVDFLFVIDNSGSMGDEQAALVANFPAFINGIQNTLDSVDTIHVGVVTTDAYTANIAGCQQLSSLVVQTGGFDSSNMVCGPYADGYNFMTEADDLPTSFSCAAQVGTQGSASERQMQATVEAVTGVEADPGECNEGFIREDALLVIVIITDESDNASTGTPMTWYDDIVAAKAGIPENIVVLSLINTPGGICGAFDVAQDIADFTTSFGDNGFMADICLPDFGPVFDEAVGIIDVACENYIPPD